MRSDLSEHYCCVQKGMKNHIRVIWTHKLFSSCPNLQIILTYLLCISNVLCQGGLKLQARTLATLPHSLVGHSMTYEVPKILKPIRHLK
jgi:hypothetical protein